MIQLPYKFLVAGGILLAILIGWFVTYQKLQTEKAKCIAAEEREARAVEITLDCQSNREAIEARLDEVLGAVDLIAEKEANMQGAIEAASIRTREIAEARAELQRLRTEHQALVDRAVPLDACQTYELVLAAIAGGPHEP